MRMHTRLATLLGALAVATAATASAQTDFPETEPNGTKAEATAANCMVAGDTLSGVTTGTSLVAANTLITSADTFRVKTCTLPAGIYKHELVITTSGTAGHTGNIRGLDQTGTGCVTGGTITATSNTALQVTTTASVPPRKNMWYGFGRGDELYVSIGGTASTTAGYVATLGTSSVAATTIGPFDEGAITITTCGQGHVTDTDMYVFDANLVVVPTFINDDQCPAACAGHTFGSTLTRTYPAGRYYLAMSTFSTSTDQPAPVDDRVPTDQDATDFPDLIVRSAATAGPTAVSFAVTDIGGTTPVAATLVAPAHYQILWFKFDVVPASTITAMCEPGVAGVMACACGNPNGAGRGCANTGSAGASLAGAGSTSLTADSVDPGSVTLTGTDMLSGSTCIFLQGGTLLAAGTTFGAGIRCAEAPLKRLYTKSLIGLGGLKTAPEAGDRSISNRSADLGDTIANGSRRWYQTYYRDPGLVNPGGGCPVIATFNITSGVELFWTQ